MNGRVGRGNKLFSREEAGHLVDELNQEYPEIEHNMVEEQAEGPLPENAIRPQSHESAPRESSVAAEQQPASDNPEPVKPEEGDVISRTE